MRFRRICKDCGELCECGLERAEELRCPDCGGELAGPVAPVPETRDDRCRVLASPFYAAYVAGRAGPLRSTW